jgi:hypothetical protein
MCGAFVSRLGLRFASLSVATFLVLGGGSILTPSNDGFSGVAYAQEGGTQSSSDSNAGADSGAGSTADSSASADAGATNSGGNPTASAEGSIDGGATGGDTSAGPDSPVGAEASATAGETATAETSTTAGTSASSTAGNYKSVYAAGGTVYEKKGKKKGYAVAYQDGAYSAAYYKGKEAGAFSGIYTGEKFSDRRARSLFRGFVTAGAWADRYQAGAYASAYAHAEGWNKGHGASAKTGADAFAWVNKRGQTVGETSGFASAWAGKPERKTKARRTGQFVTSSCQGSKWKHEFRKRCRIWD